MERGNINISTKARALNTIFEILYITLKKLEKEEIQTKCQFLRKEDKICGHNSIAKYKFEMINTNRPINYNVHLHTSQYKISAYAHTGNK